MLYLTTTTENYLNEYCEYIKLTTYEALSMSVNLDFRKSSLMVITTSKSKI